MTPSNVAATHSADLIQELEKQTLDQVRTLRASERVTLKAEVVLQPGNSSHVMELKARGLTEDISTGGCRAIFPIPIHVGDIYRLQFNAKDLDLPLLFARCLRCRLIREDAFEAGFSFFAKVTLPTKGERVESESLL